MAFLKRDHIPVLWILALNEGLDEGLIRSHFQIVKIVIVRKARLVPLVTMPKLVENLAGGCRIGSFLCDIDVLINLAEYVVVENVVSRCRLVRFVIVRMRRVDPVEPTTMNSMFCREGRIGEKPERHKKSDQFCICEITSKPVKVHDPDGQRLEGLGLLQLEDHDERVPHK